MNNLILQFPIKPLSVNSKFTINKWKRKIVKSTSANRFEKVIKDMLLQYSSSMKNFKKLHNRKKYALNLDIVMYVPEAEFFTLAEEVDCTCIDASNALKMLEDIIYKQLGLNDGLNTKVTSEKRPYRGEDWLTLVTVSEVPIPKAAYLDVELDSWLFKA